MTIRRPIPIPTPLKYIPSHVVQPIPVRRKITHRTRVGIRPGIEKGVEAIRPQIVAIIVGSTSVVVGLALGYRVAPRKPLPTQPTPSRLLPLRFRRQTITIGGPIHIRRQIASLIDVRQTRIRVIHRRQTRLLRPRIAPLHHVIPIHRLHRIIRRLARTGMVKAIAVARGVGIDRLP